MPTVLASIALAVALLAAGFAAYAARQARAARRRPPLGADLPLDVDVLRDEVQGLRDDATETIRHMSAVRYDAFGDMGGHLSWSLALLDDNGSGVVLTSIHGRSDSRTYVKNIENWTCDQQLSPEETDAIQAARERG